MKLVSLVILLFAFISSAVLAANFVVTWNANNKNTLLKGLDVRVDDVLFLNTLLNPANSSLAAENVVLLGGDGDDCGNIAAVLLDFDKFVTVGGVSRFELTITPNENGQPDFTEAFVIASAASCAQGTKLVLTVITDAPTNNPTTSPTFSPSVSPTNSPTFSPSLSPTLSPSFSPTLSPTNSPIFTVNNDLIWDIPSAVDRFFQKAFVTEQETLSLLNLGPHNVVEFPSKADFDACDFTNSQLLVDSSLTFPISVGIGEARFFGCNITDNGETHCKKFNQKIEVSGLARAKQNLVIDWQVPTDPFFFVNGLEATKDQAHEFIFSGTDDVVQFLSKASFDACDVTDTIPKGVASPVVTRDVFADDTNPDTNVIFYGSSANGGAHCLAGLKVAVNIIANDGDTSAPTQSPIELGANFFDNVANIAGVAAGAGAFLILAVIVIALLIRRRSRNSNQRASRKLFDIKQNAAADMNSPYAGPLGDQEVKSRKEEQSVEVSFSMGVKGMGRTTVGTVGQSSISIAQPSGVFPSNTGAKAMPLFNDSFEAGKKNSSMKQFMKPTAPPVADDYLLAPSASTSVSMAGTPSMALTEGESVKKKKKKHHRRKGENSTATAGLDPNTSVAFSQSSVSLTKAKGKLQNLDI